MTISKCKAVLYGTVAVFFTCGGHVDAAESSEFQRVATRESTPLEVSVESTVLAQPGAPPRVLLGGIELEAGIRLWDRWSISALGRVPVDVRARPGTSYTAGRTSDGSVGITTAYGFGPSHLRHRISLSAETSRSYNGAYTVAIIRDPVVQGAGMTVDVTEDENGVYETNVGVPLSVALVVNDITSIHAELTPSVGRVLTNPRGTLSAVIATRWAWDKVHAGSAALFGRQGAPGGIALSGGWKWRNKR